MWNCGGREGMLASYGRHGCHCGTAPAVLRNSTLSSQKKLVKRGGVLPLQMPHVYSTACSSIGIWSLYCASKSRYTLKLNKMRRVQRYSQMTTVDRRLLLSAYSPALPTTSLMPTFYPYSPTISTNNASYFQHCVREPEKKMIFGTPNLSISEHLRSQRREWRCSQLAAPPSWRISDDRIPHAYGHAGRGKHWKSGLNASLHSGVESLTGGDKPPLVLIGFDLETTGLGSSDRIIEVAARDRTGGPFSSMESLVNPRVPVPLGASRSNNIYTNDVCRPDVPDWAVVGRAFIDFVESRRQSDVPIVLAAHNGQTFDVPVLKREFERYKIIMPSNWLFLDTLVLGRVLHPKSLAHLAGPKNLKLATLHSHYGLPSRPAAHRAGPDVLMLLDVINFWLENSKLPLESLCRYTFGADGNPESKKRPPSHQELARDAQRTKRFEMPLFQDLQETREAEESAGRGRHAGAIEGTTRGFVLSEENELANKETVNGSSRGGKVADDAIEGSLGLHYGETGFPVFNVKDTLTGRDLREAFSSQDELPRRDESNDVEKWMFDEDAADRGWNPLATEQVSVEAGRRRREAAVSPAARTVGERASEEVGREDESGARELEEMADSAYVEEEAVGLRPEFRAWLTAKKERPDYLLLFQNGDSYEAYFEDADVLATGISAEQFTRRIGGEAAKVAPIAAAPCSEIERSIPFLLGQGFSIGLFKEMDVGTGHGESRWQATSVLTPGTTLDPITLPSGSNNFLVSIVKSEEGCDKYGLAYADVSTGEFWATEVEGEEALRDEILRLNPAELLLVSQEMATTEAVSLWRSINQQNDVQRRVSLVSEGSPADTQQPFWGGPKGGHLSARGAATLLVYVQDKNVQASSRALLQRPRFYDAKSALQLNPDTVSFLELVEFPRGPSSSLQTALNRTMTTMGTRKLRQWLLQPSCDMQTLLRRHDAVEALTVAHSLRESIREQLSRLADIQKLTSRLAWNMADAGELIALASSVATVVGRGSGHSEGSGVLLEAAQKGILPEGLLSKSILLSSLLEGQLKSEGFRANESDTYGYHRQVEELNGSGNFKATDAALKLKVVLGEKVELLWEMGEALAEIDVLASFAEVAAERGYVRPRITEDYSLSVFLGWHPSVEAALPEGQPFVHNSIFLSTRSNDERLPGVEVLKKPKSDTKIDSKTEEEVLQGEERVESGSCSIAPTERVEAAGEAEAERKVVRKVEDERRKWPLSSTLLLVGPRHSGKTCYLSQIGQIQVMAQMGSFVPAYWASVGIADSIMVSPKTSGKPFSSGISFKEQLQQLSDIAKDATGRSLVLLDDLEVPEGLQTKAALSATLDYIVSLNRPLTLAASRSPLLHHLVSDSKNWANMIYCHFGPQELTSDWVSELDYELKLGKRSHTREILSSEDIASLPKWVQERMADLARGELESGLPSLGSGNSSGREGGGDGGCNAGESGLPPSENDRKEEQLKDIWEETCAMLESRTTQALTRQKGSLLSVSSTGEGYFVRIGTAAKFVDVFRKDDHSKHLSKALRTALGQPVMVDIVAVKD